MMTSTPSPSPSPSPPPPPRMTEEKETRLVQRVMEDSMNTHDKRQWVGLEEMMAFSATGDVATRRSEELVLILQYASCLLLLVRWYNH
ncbi:rRNA N-glycosidase [Hordeum vulgare]|nr:rRNA N-glycosidase [Hordeum vulgare]